MVHRNRQIYQWNRINNPEKNANTHNKLYLAKEPRTLNGGKKQSFQRIVYDKWIFTYKRMDLYLTSLTKLTVNKCLNVRPLRRRKP